MGCPYTVVILGARKYPNDRLFNDNVVTGQVRDSISNSVETGTVLLEFGTLSKPTGNPLFYDKAKQRALVETYKRPSAIDLVGAALNVETGEWTDRDSHISGGIVPGDESSSACSAHCHRPARLSAG